MTSMTDAARRYPGCLGWRDLPDGRVLVLYPMIFTVRLCVGPQNSDGYDRAWCYDNSTNGWHDAHVALEGWDGNGEPPGTWIKEVGR